MEHPGVCINNNTNVLYEKDRRVECSSLECQAHKNTKNRKFVTLSIPTYLGRLKKILFFLYNNKFSNIIKKCPQLNLKQTLKWTYTCNRVNLNLNRNNIFQIDKHIRITIKLKNNLLLL